MKTLSRSLLILAALIGFSDSFSAVFSVPRDFQLIRQADGIVLGEVIAVQPQMNADGPIETIVRIRITETFKGPFAAGEVELYVPGGVVGSRALMVSGAPTFHVNEDVLVFLFRDDQGRWTTYGLGLGKFTRARDGDGQDLLARFVDDDPVLLLDSQWHRVDDVPRASEPFLEFIRGVLSRERLHPELLGMQPLPRSSRSRETIRISSHYPPSAYVMPTFRWDRFDLGQSVTFRKNGDQPGYDTNGAVTRSLAAWNNDSGSNVNYLNAGTTTAGFVQDGINAMVFNAPTGVPPGAVGYSQIFANATHTYQGETFYSISEGDIILKSNLSVSQTVFEEIVTHELGHTLGFRHSTDRAPSSADAVMYPTARGIFGANLGSWDREALAHVYTAACVATFSDVPCSHPFFTYIETIVQHGITGGCGGGNYCPDAATTRSQMAIFLLRGKYTSAYNPPPATGQVFTDVPAGAFAAAWIEQLYREGITGGCGGGNYCPNASVTRAQMAIFLLRSKHGAAYTPPAAVGIFADVPPTDPAAPWIEQLYREGITGGCSATHYCPGGVVTRGQMAVFITRTFNLQ